MRWKISPHDHRQVDLLAIIALLILVAGSIWYLSAAFTPAPSSTAFIVPSQNVRW